jgi:Flp pilus assembly protein TadG
MLSGENLYDGARTMTLQSVPRRGRWLSWVRDPDGSNVIEVALLMPLLMLVTFGIVEFAVLFFTYISLESGVSQATRYGVTGNVMAGMSREESIKTAMRRATPTITLDDSCFTFSHLQGAAWVGGTGAPNQVEKLTVRYTYNAIVLRPLFPSGQVNLTVESSMKNEGRFE